MASGGNVAEGSEAPRGAVRFDTDFDRDARGDCAAARMIHCAPFFPPRTRAEGRQKPLPMDTPAAPTQTPAEYELAELIVQSLNIDWVKPEAIDPNGALFGGGDLGLDSIDALELALAVSKRYGFQLRSDNPDNKQIFGSLRALAEHIAQNRKDA
jgi:acyl carrier protein